LGIDDFPSGRRPLKIAAATSLVVDLASRVMAGAPLFRGGKRVSESRQILLHLVIVGRFLNLGNLIDNERPVVGKNVQSSGIARVAQGCAHEARIRGAKPLRHRYKGAVDHFLAADTPLLEAFFADCRTLFRRKILHE
jgi:hypothetical protein